jgi:hypothetical protein
VNISRIKKAMAVAVAVLALGACDDLLTVSDPQRYTASDLDEALPAVANGVEGAIHEILDSWVNDQALLGDVYQHTGTWSGYDDPDHGRTNYHNNATAGEQNAWLRAQWFAVDAEERFKRVMGDAEAASSPLTAQVQMSGGLADMLLGMTACESVAEPTGNLATDMQMLAQAESKLTKAMATAQSAGRPEYAMASQAARAQTRMLQGDWSGAVADASAIPAGFVYYAVYNVQSTNSVVQLTTKNNNEAAGLMHKWWPLIEKSDDPGFMMDPYSMMPDQRIPVYFDGEIATDNETPHYSQWKYVDDTDDIAMLHSDGMRLIIAEAMARNGDFAGATGILNELRAAVGLPGHEVPTTPEKMAELVLHERFAEHFMEGQRLVDLHRAGIVRQVFEALNDHERVGVGRPTKWPMTSTEPTYNPNINDDLTQRCLPTA